MNKDTRLTIGEFSKLSQVTVKTLRHYEKLGLLMPSKVDEWTRYRYYSPAQLQVLNSILRMKEMGFSLDEIRGVLTDGSHKPTVEQIETKIRQGEEELERLLQRLSVQRRVASSLYYYGSMERFSVQALPPVLVASHRCTIRKYEDLGPLFVHVIAPELVRLGCRVSQPVYCFHVEHGAGPQPGQLSVEYCQQVDEAVAHSPLISFRRLDAVEQAVWMKCPGPYGRLRENVAELSAYISSEGYRVAGQRRTVYVDGPWNQKDPCKWLTVLQVPVERCPGRE